MNGYTNFFSKLSIFVLLVIVAFVVNWRMIRDGVIFEAHDLLIHLTWLQHFSKQVFEGIFYPRWLAGTNYGYGSPTFVFYPPFIYYIGSLLKAIGFSAEYAIITLFWMATFLSGAGFYGYGRSTWGKLPAIVGALAFMTAPYLLFSAYVRSALPELWAIALIPIGLLTTNKALTQPLWRVGLTIFVTVLALTHVPSLLLLSIFWTVYMAWLATKIPIKTVITVVGFALIGLGIASLYLLPALLEKSLVNLDFMRDVQGGFLANLIDFSENNTKGHVKSIFLYGISTIALLSGVTLFQSYRRKSSLVQVGIWMGFSIILLLLMSYISAPLWKSSQILQMVQFPWRLLGLLAFAIAALLASAIETTLKNRGKTSAIALLLIGGLLLWNMRYSYNLSFSFSGFHNPGDLVAAQHQGRWKAKVYRYVETAIYDPYKDNLKDTKEYLPLLSNRQPIPDPNPNQPLISALNTDKASFSIRQWHSYNRIFNVTADKISTIQIRTYYYPAWHLYVDGNSHSIDTGNNGSIQFDLEPGSHLVELRYEWTTAFLIGFILSSLSIILLPILWLKTILIL